MTNKRKVRIIVGENELIGELFDTPTAESVYKALPLESKLNRWGEELYFYVPVEAELEAQATDIQEIGNICFWASGKAIAIFFGPTPASIQKEPRAFEPVNLFGKILGDPVMPKNMKCCDMIRMEKNE